jgi:hypothetical protein
MQLEVTMACSPVAKEVSGGRWVTHQGSEGDRRSCAGSGCLAAGGDAGRR